LPLLKFQPSYDVTPHSLLFSKHGAQIQNLLSVATAMKN